MEVENETVEKAATNSRSFGAFLKFAGKHAIDLAKAAWRVDAVKSLALTWAIRASIPGGAILIAVIDSYMGGS